MQAERLGIINFFGIFIPGSYVAGIIFLAMISFCRVCGALGIRQIFAIISANIVLSSMAFFFVSYLLGVLVRLFAPDIADGLSEWYLTRIRGKKDKWVTDYFPYKESMFIRLERDGMERVHDYLERLNNKYGVKSNVTFFNYCKCFIDANSQALSRQVRQAEALVRFLSGTTIALLLAIAVSFIMFFVSMILGNTTLYVIYIALFAVSLLCLLPILERFKFQRRREVFLVWFCIYIVLNGGLLEYDEYRTSDLAKNVFFG